MNWYANGRLKEVRAQLAKLPSAEVSELRQALDGLVGLYSDPSKLQIATAGQITEGQGTVSITIVSDSKRKRPAKK